MSEKSKSFLTRDTNRHRDASVANTSWLEWKDSDLNNEKWGTPKDGPDGLFLAAERVAMPRSLQPHQWIRAKDLKHLTGPLTVCTHTNAVGHSDLITNNKHLLHSEFVRWFIAALINLQYCGREGLEISGESPNFAWTSRREFWRGWAHVYSLNKAGKGVQHRPVINPNGKYVVRLHHMGCWRRFVVDDTVPVDKGGLPLLPRTSNDFELWPMLLAKAMLKIASLSWSGHREIVDFHPIACLTGWTCLTLNIAHLSSQDKWDFLSKYSEHFEWTPRTTQDHASEISKNLANDKTKQSRESPRLLADKPQPNVLFLLLRDTRELGSDAVPGLSPCWDHVIHVVQSRDVPLDPRDVKPPLERWKLHRWLNWAISRGVIDPADYFVPIRYLRAVSPLEECDEGIVCVYDETDVEENSSNPLREIERSDKSARKTKSQNAHTADPFTATKEEADVSRWVDFNKLAPYVTEAHLFYKLEYLQCSVQLTADVVKASNENRNATGTRESKKEKRDAYDSSHKTQKSANEPLYLLCDSSEEKFFLISLCAAPKQKDADLCRNDYLILEKHNWFVKSDQSAHVTTISTSGTKSSVVELEAGRQLLRMYRRSESSLAIVSSDATFHLGNRATVQQLMTAESDRIEQTSKLISDSLREAYQSFGTKDYPAMLKNYYRSYTPSSQDFPPGNNKNLSMLIHHVFMEEQVRLIGATVPDEELRGILHALRVFFLNPDIKMEYFDVTGARDGLRDFARGEIRYSRTPDSQENADRAAAIIQSFFKMVLVKKYKRVHNPEHTSHAQVRKGLLEVSNSFDSALTSQLLRNVINRHDDLRDLYPCSKDFACVLNIQEFKGTVGNIKCDQWYPIARLAMSPKSSETVYAAFDLLADLPRFTLRVFDNRNRREMTRVVNRAAPSHYDHTPTGYTVFAYGWSEKERFKEIDWAIRVVTMKGEPVLDQLNRELSASSEIKPPKLTVEELSATYIPNAMNCILRWSLRATPGSTVSMRLTVSYKMAEVRMRVTDEEGNVLASADGGSTFLLPLIILEPLAQNEKHRGVEDEYPDVKEEFRNATKEKKNLYYVQAFVLNDSWPLTDDEWMVVNRIKAKSRGNIETNVRVGNKAPSNLATRRSSKQALNDSRALELPYYILQVVTDTKDAVEISRDNRREREIALLKESWWSKDPDRPKRGRELREAFLNVHTSKIESEVSLERDERPSKEDEDLAFCLPNAEQRRTLKPPESHYLPALNLTRYVKEHEVVRDPRVQTESDYEILRDRRASDIIDSQKNYSNYLENLTKLTKEQMRRYAKLFEKKKENFRKGRALVDAAYESRKISVDTLMSETAKGKKKNGKKD